jgi:hypothetical protein
MSTAALLLTPFGAFQAAPLCAPFALIARLNVDVGTLLGVQKKFKLLENLSSTHDVECNCGIV